MEIWDTRLPLNLATITDDRLVYFGDTCSRDLQREATRVANADPQFADALRNAIAVEDEIRRRLDERSGARGQAIPTEGKHDL